MKQLFTLLCCLLTLNGFCQSINTTYSEPFDEPEKQSTKVIQCRNGNTLFFAFSEKGRVDVTIYDKDHRLKGKVENESELLELGWAVRAIFLTKDEVVAFIQIRSVIPTLHRLIFSQDGKLVQSERIGEVEAKLYEGSKYPQMNNAYAVKRDPYSDSYAVVYFQISGIAKMMLMHFNEGHKEIGRGLISSPQSNLKFNRYCDMYINGNKSVYLCSHVFNTSKESGYASALLLSHLHEGAVNNALFAKAKDEARSNASVALNPKTNLIEVVSLVPVKTTDDRMLWSQTGGTTTMYSSNLTAFNSSDLSVRYSVRLDDRLVTQYRKTNFGNARDFLGIPKDLLVNEDGITSIISVMAGNGDDQGLVDYDLQGVAIKGYAIRKYNLTEWTGTDIPMNEISRNRQGNLSSTYGTRADPSFLTYDYYRTSAGQVFFFNDHPANIKNGFEHRQTALGGLTGASIANTVCMRLTDTGPLRFHLFGDPNEDFDNRYADFSSGDYSETSGYYAVMILERKGRKKHARIAWAHLK